MQSTIWLVVSILLFVALIITVFHKMRPWGKKILLIILLLVGFIFSQYHFLFPAYKPLKASGQYKVKTEKAYYTHETAFPKMATKGKSREIPLMLWMPKDKKEEMPLMIFSHGSFGVPESNTSLFMELASQGYIVASMAHPYHSFSSTLSDGKTINVDMDFFKSVMTSQGSKDLEKTMKDFQSWKGIRIEDMNFVIDSLLADPKYGPLINKDALILAGHSLGGSVALEVGRDRGQEFLGVVSLEAPFFGDITGVKGDKYSFLEEPYPIPVLHFYSDALWGKLDQITTYQRNQELIELKDPSFVNIHIEGVGHIGLSEFSSTSPILANAIDGGMNKKDPEDKIKEINQETLKFVEDLVNKKRAK